MITRSRAWFVGLVIGSAAHVLTDTFDSVGTMLFFPFTTQHYTIGMWAYASQQGRYGDAAAYYSSLGGVWDFFWLCLAAGGWRVFSAGYFTSVVEPNDGAWHWLRRRFNLRDTAVLAMYRAYFVYGGCRIFAWFAWARLRRHAPLDWSWGGPFWVQVTTTAAPPACRRTLHGVWVWRCSARCSAGWCVRRLWRRGGDPQPLPRRVVPMRDEDWSDVAVYAVAAGSLIGLGVWLTTPILNWIVGPAWVVTVVSLLHRRRCGGCAIGDWWRRRPDGRDRDGKACSYDGPPMAGRRGRGTG